MILLGPSATKSYRNSFDEPSAGLSFESGADLENIIAVRLQLSRFEHQRDDVGLREPFGAR